MSFRCNVCLRLEKTSLTFEIHIYFLSQVLTSRNTAFQICKTFINFHFVSSECNAVTSSRQPWNDLNFGGTECVPGRITSVVRRLSSSLPSWKFESRDPMFLAYSLSVCLCRGRSPSLPSRWTSADLLRISLIAVGEKRRNRLESTKGEQETQVPLIQLELNWFPFDWF